VKVLVCGSRDWDQPMVIQHYLRQLPRVLGTQDITVIHGAARGADEMAGRIADAMGYAVEEFPADWRGKGKRAGILRNLAMLDQQPDLVLAFQRDGSTGTQHTIDEARRRGVPVKVFSA
jgi:aspartate aminotransferase-like enzyme